MKPMNLEPTRENIMKTLVDDLLKRNGDVWYFARLCDAQETRCSIAVDGKWGSGKTFFVKHTQLLIESNNPSIQTINEEERLKITRCFKPYINACGEGFQLNPEVCVYYDAWSNDNDEDPILSLIYSIVQNTTYYSSFEKGVDCLSVVSSIVDLFTGRNASGLVNLLKSSDPLSELKAQKELSVLVEEFLDSLLYEQGNRLIVFIDELDRCRPEFAIKLLERMKHYFSNDRITFVFSVNLEELQHSIKKFYGEGFKAYKYGEPCFFFAAWEFCGLRSVQGIRPKLYGCTCRRAEAEGNKGDGSLPWPRKHGVCKRSFQGGKEGS